MKCGKNWEKMFKTFHGKIKTEKRYLRACYMYATNKNLKQDNSQDFTCNEEFQILHKDMFFYMYRFMFEYIKIQFYNRQHMLWMTIYLQNVYIINPL